tara:strand:+ start:45 stop:959 length:915 start_codon:yes stop_codon:yes gene_type:complete
MSKLSRKEFKELLTEWKQNFINERPSQTIKSSGLINNDFPIDLAFVVHDDPQNEKLYSEFNKEMSDYEKLGDEYQYEEKTVLVDKNIDNVERILNLCKTNNEQKRHIEKSLNTNNLLIIINLQADLVKTSAASLKSFQSGNNFDRSKYKLGLFSDTKNLREIISWSIHDFFHGYFDIVSSTNMMNLINKENQENSVDFEGRYVSNFVGRKIDDSKFMSETEITKELVSFFDKEEFTKGVGEHDIPASIFAYSLLMIKNKNDIDKLGLSKITTKYFKQMYKLSKNAIERMSHLKNKILFFHNMGK